MLYLAFNTTAEVFNTTAEESEILARQMRLLPALQGRAGHLSSVTSKGQTTIPADIRREAGIKPGDKVLFSIMDGRISIEKAKEIDDLWNASQSQMMGEWSNPDEDVYND